MNVNTGLRMGLAPMNQADGVFTTADCTFNEGPLDDIYPSLVKEVYASSTGGLSRNSMDSSSSSRNSEPSPPESPLVPAWISTGAHETHTTPGYATIALAADDITVS